MDQDHLIALAADMLRGNETYIADAREGAPVGNSVVGSLLSLQHKAPRQYAEAAVMQALTRLDAEDRADADEHTLPRTGKPPLTFAGAMLAEASGHRFAGREHNRWHELAVYRTAGGKYVVSIAYRTQWQGEADRDTAEVLGAAVEVAKALEAYTPERDVKGFPPSAGYESRQARLLTDVREQYDAQVSEILAAHPVFAERIA